MVRGLLHLSESLLKNIGIKINLDFRKFNQKKIAENWLSQFVNSKYVYTQKLDSKSYFIYLNKLFLIGSEEVKLTLPDPIPIFIFTLLCGASKGFMKVLKVFIKPFEAPQRRVIAIFWKVNFYCHATLGNARCGKS